MTARKAAPKPGDESENPDVNHAYIAAQRHEAQHFTVLAWLAGVVIVLLAGIGWMIVGIKDDIAALPVAFRYIDSTVAIVRDQTAAVMSSQSRFLEAEIRSDSVRNTILRRSAFYDSIDNAQMLEFLSRMGKP